MSNVLYPSVFKKIYAIIGYNHRGCPHRLKNLRSVLQHYALDKRVQVLLVTNIPDEVVSWDLETVNPIYHQKQRLYSHNEAMLVGLAHAPAGAAVAFMDADKIFIRGSLFSSVAYLDVHPLVAPLGIMYTLDIHGEKLKASIPASGIVGRKELLAGLIQAIGGDRIRGWGLEDVALLIAARQKGLIAKRHYVETVHLWRPQTTQGMSPDHLLQGVCSALKLPLMNTRELRLHALQPVQQPRGYYNAMRGLGSAHYMRELCAVKTPLQIHLLRDGQDDFLGQVHHAGIHIHSDNLPCELCANSDAVGAAIWASHRQIAINIGAEPRSVLRNLWYATVAAGWSMPAWQHIQSLIRSEIVNLSALEYFAQQGLQIALSGMPHYVKTFTPAREQIYSS